MKILIVDDSPNAREIIALQLSIDKNIEIVGYAENGVQAVSSCKLLRPDIILMDIHMPIMNGIEAIRSIMRECPTPIVVLTDDFTGPRVSEALNAGALEILDKPNLSWGKTEIEDFCGTLKFIATTPLPRYL